MKKWLISSVMFFGVILNSEAQITLPTTNRSTTTVTTASEPVKENKVKRNMGTGIPELPTIKKEDVPNTIVPIENVNKLDEVPQALPTLPTTTTPKREAASVVVKRRQTPRAKAIIRHPKADDNEIYESAEHIHTYPGGAAALMEFIKSNLQYPEEAKAEMAEGLVQVSFVVEKDGTTSDFEVIDEHHPALEAEAVRVLQAMPKWNPGIQDGVKVRVEYTVPVKFTLPQEDPIENNNTINP